MPQHFPPERDALADVLRRLHDTLEVLHLPSLSARSTRYLWSLGPACGMRELVLQGELPENIRGPFIALLSGMPKLRVLHLKFALPLDVEPQVVWPPGLGILFP